MTNKLKALIEDLRLNHEYCPKEVILQAADELDRLRTTIYTDNTQTVANAEKRIEWLEEVWNGSKIIIKELEADVERLTLEKKAAAMNYEAVIEGLKAQEPLTDEDFWQGVCESLDMEFFGYRVSFNEGKTWTFWETDPRPSALASHPNMVVLPIYFKKYEHSRASGAAQKETDRG